MYAGNEGQGAQPSRRVPGLDPRRAWAVAILLAAFVAFALPAGVHWGVRAAAAWDAAVLILLGQSWWIIARSDAASTRLRAAAEDPGRILILASALLASTVSLIAAIVLLRRPPTIASEAEAWLLVGLGVVAVASAWTLMHTAFALHYAHLYYRDRGDPGGLQFAGDPPDEVDFAYFAFMIGVTFSGADVVVSRKDVRRVVLIHAVLSFGFNTTILALAVSVLFARFA